VFQKQPDLIHRARVLAETMMCGLGRLHLLLKIDRQMNRKAARQRGLPAD
jgi:hypothetical protein